MPVLIVAATQVEVSVLCEQLQFRYSINNQIKRYGYNDGCVDVLITGVGMAATAYHLGKALSLEKYSLVINAGIAGAFNTDVFKLGEVVNIKKEIFADMGAEDGAQFLNIFDLQLQDKNEFPFIEGCLINDSDLSEITCLNHFKIGSSITVNTCHGNEISIEKVREKYSADLESMEGASVFYVCLMEKVPFLQIRTISNKIERRNRQNWNIPLAVNNLNAALYQIIKQISQR